MPTIYRMRTQVDIIFSAEEDNIFRALSLGGMAAKMRTRSSRRPGWSVTASPSTPTRSCATWRGGWRIGCNSPRTAGTSTQGAVARGFHYDVDYAQVVKQYGTSTEAREDRRYSPPLCLGAIKTWVSGKPVVEDASTSYVERANHYRGGSPGCRAVEGRVCLKANV